MATTEMQSSALKKNGHVVLKGRPCEIIEIATSKSGKHGHSKVFITGKDIFTSEKIEDMFPATHNVQVPTISREQKELYGINLEDNTITLLDNSILPIPNGELGAKLKALDPNARAIVTVLEAMGLTEIISLD
ncbi:unnamed protein product [Owenia fusiformis]|uniref:Eukaryotic translation initiation factor 5A n=1 Tax=Owenia fusiformis TaxID=6347 RepID=A0A8J1Y380_OWEFU|nr:unnamed protein product [Owenia fusiformis]